ncbi:hypothetical protein B566_EDAN001754 [Ephemera danica]|nr:hypothetical protein B566_EDAN001754 [Ephemera danica]
MAQQPLTGSSRSQGGYGSMAPSNPVPEVDFSQFSPTEFYNLCESITTNIYTINTSWKQLEEALKSVGTERDSSGLRDKVHVGQMSTNQIVSQTTRDLQRLTTMVRRASKAQRLQVERLTAEFREAVQRYGQAQKQVATKLRASALVRPPVMMEEEERQDLAIEEQQRLIAQQRQLQRELEFEHGMLHERERRMRQIEEDVLDVNQIMRELAAMVHDQGESITSIEDNIERVHSNVTEGRQQVQQAAQYQVRHRRKIFILVCLALVVCAIIIGVIAIKLS